MILRRKIAFLGPEGTFTDEASFKYAPSDERIPYPTLRAVMTAVESGEVDEGVVPIENSLIGPVLDIVDFLISSGTVSSSDMVSPLIKGEILLKIDLCLIAPYGSRTENIRVVRSKAEALNQCGLFLWRSLPHVKADPARSTAAAVASLTHDNEDGTIAAIGPKRAAEITGMNILASGIQDSRNNVTRFAVIGRDVPDRSGDDKTSLVFDFPKIDIPGQLVKALKLFSKREINLTKIESRPTGEQVGSYYFLLDCEGHVEDENIAEALAELKEVASKFKVLGSYKRGEGITL